MKFKETWFPAKEITLAQPGPAPLSSCQIPESDNESDSLGLGLVKLAQPPARPICIRSTSLSQPSIPQSQPLSPPLALRGIIRPLPGVETAPLQPPTPQYSLHPMKEWLVRGSQAGPSTESINNVLIHTFQEAPNSYWEAMNSLENDKWLQASFKGLNKMGVWKSVDYTSNCNTIKCRWTLHSKISS